MMRYTASRKFELITAALESAGAAARILAAHGVSAEEFASWRERHRLFGLDGLKTTKFQRLRKPGQKRGSK